jgi:nucleoside triphosphate diphosphatase
LQDEVGDLLFTVLNLARYLEVDPESALRQTNRKFRRRFGHVEARLREEGKELGDASLEEMEKHWQNAKTTE